MKRSAWGIARGGGWLTLATAISFASWQSAGAQDGVIHACYAKATGQLRVVDREACKHNELPLSWNEAGPQGPAGAPGQPGAPGAPGPAGSARAYGLVDEGCNPLPGGGCSTVWRLERSLNASMTNPVAGIFCISVADVSSADLPIVVSLADRGDITAGEAEIDLTDPANPTITGDGPETAFVVWRRHGADCPTGQYEVNTLAGGAVNKDGAKFNDSLSNANEPFTFMVP